MANSGEIYTGYQNYTRFYMRWWLVQQDVPNNRSLISWEIGVQGTAGATAYWYSNAVRIDSGYLDGQHVQGSITFSNITLAGAALKPLRSGSVWVGHNADGAKSFGASVSGWLYANGSRSASGSWSLPTIPRNSQVSTNDSGAYDLGTPLTIRTNRKSTSFSHTITIRLNNSSGTVLQTFNSVGDSVIWTPTEAQITTMQNAIPTSNRLTLHINQYNNQVAANSSVSLYTYLRDANPTFDDFTFEDTDATTVAITGNDQVLVKGKSVLGVTVPSAEKMVAIKGASEDYYSVSFDGISNQVDYDTGDVSTSFSSVATTGTRTILVTAFDSRANATRVSKDVIVYDYTAPTISTTLTRENNFDEDTTIHIEGTYTPLVISGVAKNSLQTGTLQYRYKEDGGSFGSWVTVTFTPNTTDGTFSVTDFVVALDNTKKYVFEFHIDDEFGTVTTTNSVDVGTPIMFVGNNSGLPAIGIGKMPENGALDVDGDIYSNGALLLNENSEIDGANINLDTIQRDVCINYFATPTTGIVVTVAGEFNIGYNASASGLNSSVIRQGIDIKVTETGLYNIIANFRIIDVVQPSLHTIKYSTDNGSTWNHLVYWYPESPTTPQTTLRQLTPITIPAVLSANTLIRHIGYIATAPSRIGGSTGPGQVQTSLAVSRY